MANKFATYILIMSGTILIFYFLGLLDSTASVTARLLSLLLNPESIKTTSFYIGSASAVIGVLSGAAILVRLGFRTDLVVFSSFVFPLMSFGWDFLLIFNKFYSVSVVFAVLFFSPLFLLYVLTVLEWWRGVTG